MSYPAATARTGYPIPTSGILCEGQEITLAWPRPEQYDGITALRNLPRNRKGFLDNRPLDPAQSRHWLAYAMDRPREALLAVNAKCGRVLLGTIGWTDWDLETAEADFGRIVLDARSILGVQEHMPPGYQGVALDMGSAMIRFAFQRMQLRALHTSVLADNFLAVRFNEQFGLERTGEYIANRPNGDRVTMLRLTLTRQAWEKQSAAGQT